MNKPEISFIEASKFDEPKSIKTLLDESVTHIADQWIEQLTILRKNADALEAQIIACVGKTKADITTLHELGAKVAEEARRGQEVCKQLADGVGKIAP